MARLNVYLPDDVATRAREAGLNVSALTREAVERRLEIQSVDTWLRSLPAAPIQPIGHSDVIEALDAVREERSTRHG